jgi:hypothetical protein
VIDFRDRHAPGYKPYTEEEIASYQAYVAWKRLSHSGRRSRADLSSALQEEWDAAGIKEGSWWPALDHEAVKRLYEEVLHEQDKKR